MTNDGKRSRVVGFADSPHPTQPPRYHPPMTYAVIFDIDGVLIDSYQAHFESWRQIGRQFNQDITEQQFAGSFGRTSKDIIRLWFGALLGDKLTDQHSAEIDEHKEAASREVVRKTKPVMPGAVALIDALYSAGFKLGVGSSGPPANVELSLQLLERVPKFGAKVTGMDVTGGKPDPQVFQIAASRLGVEPAKCAVIEDAPAGVAAANAAGMTSIALLGTAPREKLAAARRIVGSLKELTPADIAQLIDAPR